MADYTPKLHLPIPEVTRNGDVNDVIDVTNTVVEILNYIDAGSGDYLTGFWMNTAVDVTGGVITYGSDIGPFTVPAHEEGYDEDKIGWDESGESVYAKINAADSTIEIKKGGIYKLFLSVSWTTEATDGAVSTGFDRNDVQPEIIGSGVFTAARTPVVGDPFQQALGQAGAIGWVGPHYFKEGAIIRPMIFSTEDISVNSMIVGIERI